MVGWALYWAQSDVMMRVYGIGSPSKMECYRILIHQALTTKLIHQALTTKRPKRKTNGI